jgi:hypothetical protein
MGTPRKERDMATTQTPVRPAGVTFLADWLGDRHRPLADAARDHVGRYVQAIVAHDDVVRGLSPDAQRAVAASLWKAFRVAYDDLRGPYARSEQEDVGRALGRI